MVEGYGDYEYFEAKGNAIYLKKDHADSGKTEFNIKVSALAENEAYYTTLSIDVLTKSKSKNQLYPEFAMSETKENTDTTVSAKTEDPGESNEDPEIPGDDTENGGNVIIFVIIGVVVVIIAVVAVVILGKKNKKTK